MYGFQTYVAYLLSDIPTALNYADAQLRYESPETTGMTKIHIWFLPTSAWDDFVGMVSHELKTPLTSINGYMEVIDAAVEGEEMKFFGNKISK